jgi:hypothetical protein
MGKKKKMWEVLSTSEINSVLEKVDIFKGAYPSDLLPIHIRKDTQAYIINTADSNHPGEHWIAIVLDENQCLYFDSFGYQLLNLDILNKIKKAGVLQYQFNNKQIQPFQSENCGYYCIAFILSCQNGVTFSKFLNNFSTNPEENNVICYELIKNNMFYS